MPIELHCPACGQMLRVPDEAAGRKAKCPKCQQSLDVPGSTSAALGGGFAPLSSMPPPPKPASQEFNPYATPQFTEPSSLPSGGAFGEIRPSTIDIGNILNASWNRYSRDFGTVLGMTLLAALVSAVVNLPLALANIFLQQVALVQMGALAMFCVQIVFFLISLPVQSFFLAGQLKYFLAYTRRQRAEISDLFAGGPYVLQLTLASLIINGPFMLVVAAVSTAAIAMRSPEINLLNLLIYIPMIFVFLTYGQCSLLVVDRGMAAVDSLHTSARITPGNRLSLFVLGLAMVGLMIAGMLACLIGIIFVIPLMLLIPILAYRQMTGENIE